MKTLFKLVMLTLIPFFGSAQEGGTGLLMDSEKYEATPLSAPILTRSFTSLPTKFSLKSYAPTPGNQGRQGSCVGWASSYGARTIAFAVRNGWNNQKDKINANAFSPSFVYNQIKNPTDYKCQRGSYIADALTLLQRVGDLKNRDFPYNQGDCNRKPTLSEKTFAKSNSIITYERLARWNNPYNLVGKVKKAISQKNPVIIGMFKYGTLSGYGELWTPKSISNRGGHAMVVVGYDDNKYGGAFEIMNSWGTNFRNGGFFWVRYNDFNTYVKTAYVLIDNGRYDNDKKIDNNVIASSIEGEIKLMLNNGNHIPISLSNNATRNFNIVKATKATYTVNESYKSGSQFRIYLKSKQRGYVYLIGYGGADKSVHKLYPFDKYSPLFNYTNSEIAIPNEDYFIEFDNKPGQDILCVLYSTEPLDIESIVSSSKNGDFVSSLKRSLGNKIYSGENLTFSKDKIAFKASSKNKNSKVVPIFISMNHL